MNLKQPNFNTALKRFANEEVTSLSYEEYTAQRGHYTHTTILFDTTATSRHPSDLRKPSVRSLALNDAPLHRTFDRKLNLRNFGRSWNFFQVLPRYLLIEISRLTLNWDLEYDSKYLPHKFENFEIFATCQLPPVTYIATFPITGWMSYHVVYPMCSGTHTVSLYNM